MALSAAPETYGPDMEQRSQELDWNAQMSYMHFRSVPSARVIPVSNTFQSPKSPWRRWSPMTGIWKGREHAVDGAYTLSACKNAPRINILMPSKFCPLLFFHPVWIHFVHPWSGAGDPSDLNEYMSYSSQTACIRLIIAQVHPQGEAHQTTRGLPELRELLLSEIVTSGDP